MDILFILTHQYYPTEVTKKHWYQIVKHKNALTQTLGRNTGIVVAALDYLTKFNKNISSNYVLIPEKSIWAVSEITLRDHLTGLYDKGTFQAKLNTEMKRVSQYGNTVSLILMNLDNFKETNDVHGHIAGDDVLTKKWVNYFSVNFEIQKVAPGPVGKNSPFCSHKPDWTILLPQQKESGEGLKKRSQTNTRSPLTLAYLAVQKMPKQPVD